MSYKTITRNYIEKFKQITEVQLIDKTNLLEYRIQLRTAN